MESPALRLVAVRVAGKKTRMQIGPVAVFEREQASLCRENSRLFVLSSLDPDDATRLDAVLAQLPFAFFWQDRWPFYAVLDNEYRSRDELPLPLRDRTYQQMENEYFTVFGMRDASTTSYTGSWEQVPGYAFIMSGSRAETQYF